MVDLNSGVGVLDRSKVGGTTEIRPTQDWSKSERRGRWKRRGVQQRSRPAAADYGDTGRYNGGVTFGEPALLLCN